MNKHHWLNISLLCCVTISVIVLLFPLFNSSDSAFSANSSTAVSQEVEQEETDDTLLKPQPLYVVSQVGARLYEQASTYSTDVTGAAKGSVVLALHQTSDGWTQIQYNKRPLWIENKFLSPISSGFIPVEQAKLLSQANSGASVLDSIPKSTNVPILEETEEFVKIIYKQTDGYVAKKEISATNTTLNNLLNEQGQQPKKMDSEKSLFVKLNNTPLFTKPDVNAPISAYVSVGEKLPFMNYSSGYYTVSLANNTTAYIPEWLVTTNFDVENKTLKDTTVLLDANDKETSSLNEQTEATLTLSIAKTIQQELEAAGATVELSRNSDKALSYTERKNSLSNSSATLILRIISDGATESISGTYTTYKDNREQSIAQTINKYLALKLPLPNNGVRYHYTKLQDNITIPMITINIGYINSRADNAMITTTNYQQNIAHAIVDGLKEYYR